ncbi:MAG: hypothetical protein WC878_06265 [Candidatus Paceibacterota bacterium]|jgi:hypothetical protein
MENQNLNDEKNYDKISSLKNAIASLQEEIDEKLEKIKSHLPLRPGSDSFEMPSPEKIIRFFRRELEREIEKRNVGLRIGLEEGREKFDRELFRLHQTLKIGTWSYIKKIGFWVIATSPIIYSGIIFILLLDVCMTLCQYACFWAFNIPVLPRTGYFVFERMYLSFLNAIQKVNCGYCSYGNGLMAYDSAILARMEYLWNPEKQEKIGSWALIKKAGIWKIAASLALYAGVFAVVLLDLFVTVYQHTCFRVYKISIVARNRYFTFDASHFAELNLAQRINYALGSYCTGVIARTREVFSLTEKYWCPIKHAKKVLGYHDKYDEFAEFGNPEEFYKKYMEARRIEKNVSQ